MAFGKVTLYARGRVGTTLCYGICFRTVFVDTFKKLRGDNKELLIIADATHVDLYDQLDKIPFNQIATFYETWMPAAK